jgi:hypothetical protein
MTRPIVSPSRAALALACLIASAPAFAIFQNGGFESNDYTGWTLGGGTNPGLVGSPPFNDASVRINAGTPGPATVVTAGTTDPRAPTIQLPRAGTYTAKLNDENGGALVTTLVQTDTVKAADVDPADGLPHIRFAFAPVLDDPSHGANDQPYFYVVVKNLADQSVLFEQFAYSGQAGVQFESGSGTWKYLEFQDVDVTLPADAVGQQVELTVIAADCSQGAHGGYVYVDGFGSAQVGPGAAAATPVPAPGLGTIGLALLAALLALVPVLSRRQPSR